MSAGREGAPGLERLRAAFAMVEDTPQPGSCPSSSEIWAGLHGDLQPDRLREVVDHMVGCAACAEAWRVGLLLEAPADAAAAFAPQAEADSAPDAGQRPDGPASLPALPGRFWPPRRNAPVIAAAAALALAAILGTRHFLVTPPATTVVQRGADSEPAVTRWLTPDGAALPRQAARLGWSGAPQATYDLSVVATDPIQPRPASGSSGAPAGEAAPRPIAAAHGLAATEYLVPAAGLANLPSGAHLRASLTAHLASGASETIFRDFRLQ
jgi:hypothetical protein